ncbi:hypothetical protein MFFC18_18460 [Mariniblastus fucicola]|uniref:Uncharacterized protein n=3 Tax=Mariniblastus fucicola TaxID=980251 RepID=A0A5B9P9R8_9BACT|nr:hypothetical protein MFFC18_18460 [Mariniblastus fucicola]
MLVASSHFIIHSTHYMPFRRVSVNAAVIQTDSAFLMSMQGNQCSSPAQSSGEGKTACQTLWMTSRSVFIGVSFISGLLTFYLAYAAVLLSPGYPDDIGIIWFTAWALDSIVSASIVCAIASASLFFVDHVKGRNYAILGFICAIEFEIVFPLFIAFFGV